MKPSAALTILVLYHLLMKLAAKTPAILYETEVILNNRAHKLLFARILWEGEKLKQFVQYIYGSVSRDIQTITSCDSSDCDHS